MDRSSGIEASGLPVSRRRFISSLAAVGEKCEAAPRGWGAWDGAASPLAFGAAGSGDRAGDVSEEKFFLFINVAYSDVVSARRVMSSTR